MAKRYKESKQLLQYEANFSKVFAYIDELMKTVDEMAKEVVNAGKSDSLNEIVDSVITDFGFVPEQIKKEFEEYVKPDFKAEGKETAKKKIENYLKEADKKLFLLTGESRINEYVGKIDELFFKILKVAQDVNLDTQKYSARFSELSSKIY